MSKRTLTLRTVAGKIHKLEVPEDATVAQCKEQFRQETNTDAKDLKFIYRASILDDNSPISKYDIKEKDAIIVHIVKKQAPKPAPQPAPQQAPQQAAQPAPAQPAQPAQPQQPQARPSGPTAQPLPEINSGFGQAQQQEVNLDELAATPEFQTALASIQELGFPKSDCEAALKAALGNPDVAVAFLESGHIPSEEEIRQLANARRQTDALKQELQANPEKLAQMIAALEASSPQQGAIFHAYPELLLEQLGLDPASFPNLEEIKSTAPTGLPSLEEIRALMGMQGRPASSSDQNYGGAEFEDMPTGAAGPPGEAMPTNPIAARLASYTEEQKQSIRNLQELGFDLETVIQVYEACDKNEMLAANVLLGN